VKHAVIKMVGCKQDISFETKRVVIDKQKSHKSQIEIRSSRIDPPAGANRSICQTALRCFPTMREVLSGQGKGVVKETLQVFL
jgi:hypothetical protein